VEPAAVVTARALVITASLGAVAIAAHTAVNLRYLRTPRHAGEQLAERIAILIPARNEEKTLEATVRSALSQVDVPNLEVIVLDDGSTDETAAIVRRLAEADERLRLLQGPDEAPPAGWLGKPWACARLADATTADVVCFVDADVVLAPTALAATVALLRDGAFGLVAPYPRQEAGTWLERLVQPLVTWSWAATMPLRWAENSMRPSLSAANGQLLVLDAASYRMIGGHGAVRKEVLEDIALMRSLKLSGMRAVTVDGSQVATCRMYEGAGQVVDGYSKSLWSAFGGPAGSVAVNTTLAVVFVMPAVAALAGSDRRTRACGLTGYLAGVASRAMVARRTGERILPDAFLHPASIAAFAALSGVSWSRHLRGGNSWKGRPVTVGATP
jgi:cellulose synthase/poly-beta-1,6-N-acetylglucosamine synthase-like glycosyltransferase